MIAPIPAEQLDGEAADDARSTITTPLRRLAGDLAAALALLTRLPVSQALVVGTGARSFPVVGALVGGVAGVPLAMIGDGWPFLASGFALATMAILTGAIHLDGLADTADALVAVGPGAAERARRDPAVGAGGIVALILVLLLQYAALGELIMQIGGMAAAGACVVAGAVSRSMPVVVASWFRGRTGASGLGAWFTTTSGWLDALIATLVGLVIVGLAAALFEDPWLIGGAAIGMGAGGLISVGLVRIRHQVDGDGLGSIVELTFLATLVGTLTAHGIGG